MNYSKSVCSVLKAERKILSLSLGVFGSFWQGGRSFRLNHSFSSLSVTPALTVVPYTRRIYSTKSIRVYKRLSPRLTYNPVSFIPEPEAVWTIYTIGKAVSQKTFTVYNSTIRYSLSLSFSHGKDF